MELNEKNHPNTISISIPLITAQIINNKANNYVTRLLIKANIKYDAMQNKLCANL